MGCLSCKKCEFIRASAFCGNTKLTQKQLYSKTGYCSHYEPKDTNNPEKSGTMNRNKVIKGMEQFRSDLKPFCGGHADWERFDAGLALLKEQEAVKPFSDDDGGYWCGSCHEDMVWHQKFCSNCGKPVDWTT